MTHCCEHSDGWHGPRGCKFPGCRCAAAGSGEARLPPLSERVTRCSGCNRRPYPDGSNHATHCPRRGEPADAPEARPRRR